MRILRPTKNRLLLEPIRSADDIVRGVFIPEAHRDKHPSIDCIVVSKGPTATDEVKIGDRVLMERFQGTDVNMGGKVFKLVTEKELLAIIE